MEADGRDGLERLEQLVPDPGAPLREGVQRELEQEHDQHVATIDRASADGNHEAALRLATRLWRFWMDSGRLADGRIRLENLLEAASDAPAALRANALYGAGTLAFRQGDNDAARALHERALTAARTGGDAVAEAAAEGGLARCGLRDGDLTAAREHARAAEAILRGLGDEAALDGPLHLLAYADYIAGDDDAARAGFEETLALNRRLGNDRNVARELTNLGSVETRAGNVERAEALCEEAMQLSADTGSAYLIPYCVVNLGGVACVRGDCERAARLLAGGKAMFDAAGAAIDPGTAIEYERYVQRTRAALGPQRYDEAVAAAQKWSHDETIRYAVGATSPLLDPPTV